MGTSQQEAPEPNTYARQDQTNDYNNGMIGIGYREIAKTGGVFTLSHPPLRN
jgi:hypothetical protein